MVLKKKNRGKFIGSISLTHTARELFKKTLDLYDMPRNKPPPFQGQITPLSRGVLIKFYFPYKMCIKMFFPALPDPLI